MQILPTMFDRWMDRFLVDESSRSELFRERVFVHSWDAGWSPADSEDRYDLEEMLSLNVLANNRAGLGHRHDTLIDGIVLTDQHESRFGHWSATADMAFVEHFLFFVRNVLQDAEQFTVEGLVEPRTAMRDIVPIESSWWDDDVKVDFDRGWLWAKDRDCDGWRLIFSDIIIFKSVTRATSDSLVRRPHLGSLVMTAADQIPAARALKDGTEQPPRGDLVKIIDQLMKDPRLAEETRSSVVREFQRYRGGKR